MVARVARERDILVFSDDIYDRFVFDEGEGEKPYLGRMYEKSAHLRRFSKTWG
jgi:aspartate/methionine/tyrosine aminotransferase